MLILFLLPGCSRISEHFVPQEKDEYIDLVLVADLSPRFSSTRANIESETGAGTFEDGDKVTLFACESTTSETKKIQLTFDGKQWTPKLTKEVLGLSARTKEVSIIAYYCKGITTLAEKVIENGKGYELSLNPDQGQKTSYESQDILVGRSSVSWQTKDRVTVTMRHEMLRLKVIPKGFDTLPLKMKIWGPRSTTLHLPSLTPTSIEPVYEWFTPLHIPTSGDSHEVFVLPLGLAGSSTDKIKIEVSSGTGTENKKSVYTLTDEQLKNCHKSGTLTIILNQGKPPITRSEYANKKVWFYGIHCPVFDEAPWVEDPRAFDQGVLTFKEEYGWFDVNKYWELEEDINGHGKYQTKDKNLCWAATASNLLHWWFRNNEPYSGLYRKWYNKKVREHNAQPGASPRELMPSFDYEPLRIEKKQVKGGSGVYKYFIETFPDAGGFTDQTLEFFFRGVPPTRPAGLNLKGKGGFFKEVYCDRELSKVHFGMSRERFNECVKNAIENKEVIGYSISGHIRNFWGAEFDEEGYVSYVYAVDNNYSTEDNLFYKGASCIRLKITYKGSNFSETYIGRTGKVPIVRLTTLGLNSKELKEFVEKNCN